MKNKKIIVNQNFFYVSRERIGDITIKNKEIGLLLLLIFQI